MSGVDTGAASWMILRDAGSGIGVVAGDEEYPEYDP